MAPQPERGARGNARITSFFAKYRCPRPRPPPESPGSAAPSAPISTASAPAPAPAPASASASSKRVVSGGLQGVANSDSDDDELPDVSTFFARPKPRPSPAGDAAARPSSRCQRSASATPPRPGCSHNHLLQLAAQHDAWQRSEARIASLERAVAEARKEDDEEAQRDAADASVERAVLVAATGSDDDQRERTLMALQRTEALHHHNRAYYFFRDSRPQLAPPPFPLGSLPDEPWAALYRNERRRREACVSGFAAEMAARHPLPVAVTNWLAHQLLYERDELLCQAYVSLLQVASRERTSVSDTIASLSSMYRTRSIFEHGPQHQIRRGLPPGLKHVMNVVQFCAPASDSVVPDAAPTMATAAFVDLALINIDEHVRQDVGLSLSLASCIEKMLDELPENAFRMLVTQAIGTLFLPDHLTSLIRCRLIASLPAGTERACHVRRRLALECFSAPEDQTADEAHDCMQSVLKSLQSRPEFNISGRTDYNLLTSMIDVLDIALSAGSTPYAELHPPRPRPVGPFSKPLRPTAAAQAHNTQVDAVVSELNYMASRIRDAGTSHLRRIEVKSQIERLVARLECSVRTKSKPKKSVFGAPVWSQAKFDKPTASSSRPNLEELKLNISPPSSAKDQESEASWTSSAEAAEKGILPAADDEDPVEIDDGQQLSSDGDDSQEFQTCVEFDPQPQ